MAQYGAGCCRVLQGVAVCCRVLQCVAVRCSAFQCVTVCYSVLQCVAVRCSVLQCVAVCSGTPPISKPPEVSGFFLQKSLQKLGSMPRSTHCNTVQLIATHCITLQHTATHCNTLQHTATHLQYVSACSKEPYERRARY